MHICVFLNTYRCIYTGTKEKPVIWEANYIQTSSIYPYIWKFFTLCISICVLWFKSLQQYNFTKCHIDVEKPLACWYFPLEFYFSNDYWQKDFHFLCSGPYLYLILDHSLITTLLQSQIHFLLSEVSQSGQHSSPISKPMLFFIVHTFYGGHCPVIHGIQLQNSAVGRKDLFLHRWECCQQTALSCRPPRDYIREESYCSLPGAADI